MGQNSVRAINHLQCVCVNCHKFMLKFCNSSALEKERVLKEEQDKEYRETLKRDKRKRVSGFFITLHQWHQLYQRLVSETTV